MRMLSFEDLIYDQMGYDYTKPGDKFFKKNNRNLPRLSNNSLHKRIKEAERYLNTRGLNSLGLLRQQRRFLEKWYSYAKKGDLGVSPDSSDNLLTMQENRIGNYVNSKHPMYDEELARIWTHTEREYRTVLRRLNERIVKLEREQERGGTWKPKKVEVKNDKPSHTVSPSVATHTIQKAEEQHQEGLKKESEVTQQADNKEIPPHQAHTEATSAQQQQHEAHETVDELKNHPHPDIRQEAHDTSERMKEKESLLKRMGRIGKYGAGIGAVGGLAYGGYKLLHRKKDSSNEMLSFEEFVISMENSTFDELINKF